MTKQVRGLRTIGFERRHNPQEREGFCSCCHKEPDERGALDGVYMRVEHETPPPAPPTFYFICLDCARAIGREAAK
jgi:hypothetical protein